MNVLIVDESKKNRAQIAETLAKNKITVSACGSTNELVNLLGTTSWDTILFDADSWRHNSPIITYFALAKKLEKFPIVFYNANEKFSPAPERQKNERDKVLQKPFDLSALMSAVA
ncbi:MAG: response regulator [Chitinivibrionales bacterium]|nr:response regulator [Chitinivibrionales bacterium]